VQVPGVISPDLSDGSAAVKALVDYLNDLGVGDEEPTLDGLPTVAPRRKITVIKEQPKMLNYKFRVNRSSPRILINLRALATYMNNLELAKAVRGSPLTEMQAARFVGWPTILLPPYPVRETKPPMDDVKVSFRFREADRAPRINIFQEGKINILGADSVESARMIYEFFFQLFTDNWVMLVCLQPRRDLERRHVARALRPPVLPAPPPARLTDAEVNCLLVEILGPDGAFSGNPDGAFSRNPDGAFDEDGHLDVSVHKIVADLGEWVIDDSDEAF